jgi:hypothetical protein
MLSTTAWTRSRSSTRATSGERHPGHVELANMAEIELVLLRGRLDPLPLDGSVLEVEKTDFAQVDSEAIMRAASVCLDEKP